jgi:hypothetical protein
MGYLAVNRQIKASTPMQSFPSGYENLSYVHSFSVNCGCLDLGGKIKKEIVTLRTFCLIVKVQIANICLWLNIQLSSQ